MQNDEFDNTIKNLANALDEQSLQNIINQLSNEENKKPVLEEPITTDDNIKEIKKDLSEISKKIGDTSKGQAPLHVQSMIEGKEHEAHVLKEIKKQEKQEKKEQEKQNEQPVRQLSEEEKKIKEEYKEKKEQLEQGLAKIEEQEKQLTIKQDEFKETFTEQDPLAAMRAIAMNPNYSDALLQYTDPKVSENQFKLFIIAQCKREIYKILKYSEYLDKLEERFEQVYIDRLDELSDGMIVRLMQIVVDKIDRGNALINSVIKDKEITNVLVINQQNNTVNNISELTKDKLLQTLYKASQEKAELPSASRAKVVETVTNILRDASNEDLESIQQNENDEYIIINNNNEEEYSNEDERKKAEIDKALAQLQKQKEGGN